MPHLWHGIQSGFQPPQDVNVVIEIPSGSKCKYELDKVGGFIRVDRVIASAVYYPGNYGFIPQTYCASRVQALSPTSKCGDGDPLDICVITERAINRGEVILKARVIGGLQMVDNGEADDKIIAVLDNDQFWKDSNGIGDISPALLERLRHYFATYKLVPGQPSDVHIEKIYDREHAYAVIEAAMEDYTEEYG